MARVVIVTHRDLVAHAPQPLYLARALAARGMTVTLLTRAPEWRCAELRSESLHVEGATRLFSGPRAALALLYARTLVALLRAPLAVAFDLDTLWPVALARRVRRFDCVLYWLEPFYGDYAQATVSRRTLLGDRALRRLVPPAAIVDVHARRLAESRPRCGDPAAAFVVENAPPLHSIWNGGPPSPRVHPPRMVYAGSVTSLGWEGLELLLRAMAMARRSPTLTVLPAEGRAAARHVGALARELGLAERVEVRERVSRETLPAILREFDVGVVLYPVRPGQNVNSMLAAPNKLYEYLACGLAVISSDNETLRFVDAEGLGWLSSGRDAAALAPMLDAAADRAVVEERRRRAYDSFIRSHHYEAGAAPLVDWIQARLLRGEGASSGLVEQPAPGDAKTGLA